MPSFKELWVDVRVAGKMIMMDSEERRARLLPSRFRS